MYPGLKGYYLDLNTQENTIWIQVTNVNCESLPFSVIVLQINDTIMIHFNTASWGVVIHSTQLLQDSGWVCLLSMTSSERLVMLSEMSCHHWNC